MEQQEQVAEKVKLTRAELLVKARAAKAEKARLRNTTEFEFVAPEKEKPVVVQKPVIEAKVVKPIKSSRKQKPVVEETVFNMEKVKQELEPEIVEEVIRVPANRRKKIVKRTIEIEESETDEEVQEEIVKIPKMKKELKFNRNEMKEKLVEANSKRLLNELFS
jgi:hypothetical protein